MRSLKTLLCLIFLALITFSCDPEEIPQSSNLHQKNITADTGNQGGEEYSDRKGNKHK